MPRNAARVGDLTVHGGGITGPGCPTVLIGGQLAARFLDSQLCPLVDGLKPHGGGLITQGCPTVFIGGSMAARVGDLSQCVGPPGAIAPPGCLTVMIGI